MNQFASEKKYLELNGLKALVAKIASMRSEYMGQNEGVAEVLEALLSRLDQIVAPGTADDKGNSSDNVLPVTDDYTYTEGTLFECVAKYIQDFRDELGAVDKAGAENVYARLDQIEDWVNNGFTAEDGTTYKGLLDRVVDLEAKTSDELVASVEYTPEDEVKSTNKWEAVFKSASGKELGKIALDTSEFVIDGMLGDVKIVSIVEPGNKIFDAAGDIEYDSTAAEPWKTIVAESAGKNAGERYFVFSFKTTEAGVQTDGFDGQATGLRNIWVSVKDLHDNFEFKAEGSDYITLDVTATHNAEGAIEVVYSVALTEEASKAIGWVLNGDVDNKIDDYKTLNADVDKAQADVADLLDKVVNGFDEKDGDNGSDVPEGSTGGSHHQDGLLTRANNLEKRASALEDDIAGVTEWIDASGMVPEAYISAYFDWKVYGLPDGTGEPNLNDYL